MSPTDVLALAHQASSEDNRTLFIAVIIFQATVLTCLVGGALYKGSTMISTLSAVLTRNTVAMDNNSKVVSDCQETLVVVKEHLPVRGN